MLDLPVPSRQEARIWAEELLLEHLRRIDAHFWPGTDSLTTIVVLGGYAAAAAAEQVPGLSDLATAHPELARELEIMFASSGSQKKPARTSNDRPAAKNEAGFASSQYAGNIRSRTDSQE